VDAEHGYVLTSRHVVRGAETALVMLADGRTREAHWSRSDAHSDLAILKIDPADLVAAPLGNSDDVDVGDWVLAIGAPEGLPQTVTSGIISAKGRVAGDDGESFLQTDAAINPGTSGGPLVNMHGEVIGINTAIISPIGMNAGIGLAIPSNVARKVLSSLTRAPESAPSELPRGERGAKRWVVRS
jgi:serine protease Do